MTRANGTASLLCTASPCAPPTQPPRAEHQQRAAQGARARHGAAAPRPAGEPCAGPSHAANTIEMGHLRGPQGGFWGALSQAEPRLRRRAPGGPGSALRAAYGPGSSPIPTPYDLVPLFVYLSPRAPTHSLKLPASPAGDVAPPGSNCCWVGGPG